MGNGEYYQIYNSKTGTLVKSFLKNDLKMTRDKYKALTYVNEHNALKKLDEIKEYYKTNNLDWLTENLKITTR